VAAMGRRWTVLVVALVFVAEAAVLGVLAFVGARVPARAIVAPTGVAAVEVGDQTGIRDSITIPRVATPRNAMLVVQLEGAGGEGGAAIGRIAVPAGVSTGVVVPLDPVGKLTHRLVVALYADAGKLGVFEPGSDPMSAGPDLPLSGGSSPARVSIAVTQAGTHVASTAASLADGRVVGAREVVVGRVVAPAGAWLVVHDGRLGSDPPIGFVRVDAGESRDVRVPLSGIPGSDGLVVMLHADKGTPGVFDPVTDEAYVAAGAEVTLLLQ
jgi:hypothetical protein